MHLRGKISDRDKITEADIFVFHPPCGKVVFPLDMTVNDEGLTVVGICETCGKYVTLQFQTPANMNRTSYRQQLQGRSRT